MNKLKNISLMIVVLAMIILSACKPKSKVGNEIDYAAQGYKAATVINYELDGCMWMIEVDGKKHEPQNLDENFRKDQQKIWVKFQEVKGAVTICMAGKVVYINDIKLRQ